MQPPVSFTANIAAFNKKLQGINPSSLEIAGYPKRYLQHLLENSKYYVAIYTQVLSNALSRSAKGIEETILVDYGSGNGLLGLFAKFCGFKKVVLCDMDRDFVFASKVLSHELSIDIDQFICGNAGMMRILLEKKQVDVIVGTDVIEHIYNLDDFFKNIVAINSQMITVFTTASNPANFLKVKRLKKLQIKDEFEGSDPADFALAGAEKQEAFLDKRKKIILEKFPGISPVHLVALGTNTRGLAEEDILIAAEIFLTKQQLPQPPSHLTNTCDPISGSWTERILSFEEYENLYRRFNFSLNFKNGFYNVYAAAPKGNINRLLNLGVQLLGKNVAPFITLTGFPSKVSSL